MKILLISPLLAPKRKPSTYNIGLGYIASSLRQQGNDVSLLDIEGYRYSPDQVLNIINDIPCDVVGIGTIITGYKYVKWLTREIKRLKPEVSIWLGNSIASTIPDIVLNDMAVDVAVIGEGENTVQELVTAMEQGKSLEGIKGICFKKNGNIIRTEERQFIDNIDDLPFPAWDLFPMGIYMKGGAGSLPLPIADIVTARGCPFVCTYCYHPYMGRKIRLHSAERVIEEAKFLKSKYHVNSIVFTDDLFILDKNRVYKICDLLEGKNIKLKWLASARVDFIDEELLKRMKSAGCVGLEFGIESGSQQIINNIKKGVTVEQAAEAIKLCKKAGIEPVCSYMIGNVGETRDTVFETVSFIINNNIEPISFFFATPYPKTELYNYALREGKIKDEIALFEKYGEQSENLLINFTQMADEQLISLKAEAEDIIWRNYAKINFPKMIYRSIVNISDSFQSNYKLYGFFKAIVMLTGIVSASFRRAFRLLKARTTIRE